MRWLTGQALVLLVTDDSQARQEWDPMMLLLEQSRSQQKGLIFFVSGQQIAGVVTVIAERHVIARNQAQGNVVLRLDRIDGVAGHVETRPD